MTATKFELLEIYREVIEKCAAEKVDVGTFVLSKNRDTQLNTPVTTDVIKKILQEHSSGCVVASDYLQTLRILNDSIRYNLDGKQRIVALLLNELLPKRIDYRNTPRPNMNPKNAGAVVSCDESLLPYLSEESVDYISYLVRMSTNSDDYSAKLPITEYKVVFQELETTCTMWQLDPTENKAEMLYCRLLSEVNEQGVPVQLTNSTDDKTAVLREIIPVVHAIARYRRASQSPFYKFMNMMPSMLVDFIATRNMNMRTVDMCMDLLNDIIVFNAELKENSDKANHFLSRFHHGHPLYIDMIQVLRTQHTLMMTTGSDLMRRFGMFVVEVGCEDIAIPDSFNNFLNETRISHVYRQQQSIETA